MLDRDHHIVRSLTNRGFELSAHAYLRDGVAKTTVAAKHRESGQLVQGWSRRGLDEALRDLAKRAGLTTA